MASGGSMGLLGPSGLGSTMTMTVVCDTFVWASSSAPCLVRISATFTLSSWAARCKAVSPLYREKGKEGTLRKKHTASSITLAGAW